MLTCREVATMLSQDVDGDLSAFDRTTLLAHLAICKTCRQIKRQFQLLNSTVDRRDDFDNSDSSPGLSEDSKTRLRDSLRRSIENSEDN